MPDNMQQTKENYAAFGRGDIAAIMQTLADDVEWVVPGTVDVPTAGTYRGKMAVQEWFGTVQQTVEFHQFEPYEFIGQGDKAVVLVHVTALVRRTGQTYMSEDAHVVTWRNGKLARFQVFTDTAATAAAFRSEQVPGTAQRARGM